jgi:hypothetical protein
MEMFKSNETLADSELDVINGGEAVGGGLFVGYVGAFGFAYDPKDGSTRIGVGSKVIEFDGNNHYVP